MRHPFDLNYIENRLAEILMAEAVRNDTHGAPMASYVGCVVRPSQHIGNVRGGAGAQDLGGGAPWPVDWDHDSHCVDDCPQPATHRRLTGWVDDLPVYELVCCEHAKGEG